MVAMAASRTGASPLAATDLWANPARILEMAKK
jgi:hypothetical protein